MGCRPNYLPAVALLVAALAWRSGKTEREFRLRRWAGIFLPLILVGILLAAFNYHRFGRPTEFGFRYQLGNPDRRAYSLVHVQNLPYNLHRYLVGRPRLERYFPFIDGEAPGPLPLPPTHVELTDEVYGCLWLFPVILFAGFALLGPQSTERRAARWLAGGLGFVSLANLLLLAGFGNGCYRYPIDFLGPFSLVAALGVLAALSLSRGIVRGLWTALLLPFLAWSAAAAFCQTISISEHYNSFSTARPQDFLQAARPFNALVYAWERASGSGPRALRITVLLPRGPYDTQETLFVTGPRGLQDFCYVRYNSAGHIQVGFQSSGHGGPESGLVPVDYGRPHTFEFDYGSFLPPDDHPRLRGLAPGDRELDRRSITVLLDGQPVLDGWTDFNPAHGLFFVGKNPLDPAALGADFGGQILKVEHPLLPIPASPSRWQAAAYGPLSMSFGVTPVTLGISDPIVSLGHRHQGGIIVLERVSVDQARFGWTNTDLKKEWSPPFNWNEAPAEAMHQVRVAIGSLLPPITSSLWPATVSAAARTEAKGTLRIWLDGKLVWTLRTDFPDVAPSTVAVGQDRLFVLPRVMPDFFGKVGPVSRDPW